MKKILIAFDGSHFSEGALEFARQLQTKNQVFLAGIFLPQIDYSALWSYSGGGQAGSLFVPLVEDEDAVAVQQNIKRFEEYCIKHNIEFSVHKDFLDFAVPQLKKESRFADLLVLSSERFYEQAGSDGPNDYLKEVLHDVECPVVVVPKTFDFPVTTILAYDGKQESVYAIKQFAYLLPEFTGNETWLVYATAKEDQAIPQIENIEELAAHHYNRLTISRLEADSKKQFASWLQGKKAAIVVCGAFGKSGFPRMFHKSFISDVIKDHRFPVFIAHK